MSDPTPNMEPAAKAPRYQVLARKYRPETFADLVGQEAMVRTLRNAFAADRIAHAFIMTGIRGTGKTTTARIIAKGLNCIGPDGSATQATTEPCGKCGACRAITEGRHVDVLEYDAASHTQVDKMREILASVPYRPTEARFKIIIFDEVHMLSTGSFNALLKTLEEPPEHVKFIFATTEIRKVPVTVLSRCQRFDLRRIEPEEMIALLRRIASGEDARISDAALAMIARAAEGSARDATSLLDQAISHGAGETTAEQVRAMLGLADKGRVLDLFELVMRGSAADALQELSAQYADGADPLAVLRDLAEVTHWISVLKITPEAADDPTVAPEERDRGRALATALPMRALTRMWQMLLKALEEVPIAPNAMMAAEMAIIRLTHVADLPDPERLLRALGAGLAGTAGAPASPGQGPGGGAGRSAGTTTATSLGRGPQGDLAGPAAAALSATTARACLSQGALALADALATQAAGVAPSLSLPQDFDALLAFIRDRRDLRLLVEVESGLRLVRYAPGRIEFSPTAEAAPDLAARLGARLQGWTGQRWGISVVAEGGAPTVAETRAQQAAAEQIEALALPNVQEVIAAFPGARIADVRRFNASPPTTADPASEALPPVEDEWDPFEND